MKPKKPSTPKPPPPKPDLGRIDDTTLALLWLTSRTENLATEFEVSWAWKGHDWEALSRLHEKGLIADPVGKRQSVVFTQEGVALARALFEKLFCLPESPPEQRADSSGETKESLAKRTAKLVTPPEPEPEGKPPFSKAAQRQWDGIPPDYQSQLLGVWCIHCGKQGQMKNVTGSTSDGRLLLCGNCFLCGKQVARHLKDYEIPEPQPRGRPKAKKPNPPPRPVK